MKEDILALMTLAGLFTLGFSFGICLSEIFNKEFLYPLVLLGIILFVIPIITLTYYESKKK